MANAKMQNFKHKSQSIPSVSSLPSRATRGYLLKLSGRSILHKPAWKRKYFVLHDNKLFYYNSEESNGESKGEGAFDLRNFISCMESNAINHKKATNVFILTSAENNNFLKDKYLSAETLSEMKSWVTSINAAIHRKETKHQPQMDQEDEIVIDAKANNISMDGKSSWMLGDCKSSSLSSLPSQKSEKPACIRDLINEDRLNRSLDDPSGARAGCSELNRTYSYSSSEDSISDSLSFPNRSSVSLYTSLKRRSVGSMAGQRLSAGVPHAQHSLMGPSCGSGPSLNSVELGGSRADPRNAILHSPRQSIIGARRHLQFQGTDMSNSKSIEEDELGMLSDEKNYHSLPSNISRKNDSLSDLSLSTLANSSQARTPIQRLEPSSDFPECHLNSEHTEELEAKVKGIFKQVEELGLLYRHLDCESSSYRRDIGNLHENIATMNDTARSLEEKMNKFHSFMGLLERQATSLMMEIRATYDRVQRIVEEAERSKREYQMLQQKAEILISQLQGDATINNDQIYQAKPGLFQFGLSDSAREPSSSLMSKNYYAHPTTPVFKNKHQASLAKRTWPRTSGRSVNEPALTEDALEGSNFAAGTSGGGEPFSRADLGGQNAFQTFPKPGGGGRNNNDRHSPIGCHPSRADRTAAVHFCQDPNHDSQRSISPIVNGKKLQDCHDDEKREKSYMKPMGPIIYSTPIKQDNK